ncbi:MAG: PEP-CTERM sorting domain-containing protein [Planctomycetaceae bacterium]
MPNTVFEIQGSFKFQVDPATIGGYSLMVPEPATWGLALAGGALTLVCRRFPRC